MEYNRIIISANEALKNNNIPLAIDLFQEALKENPLSFDISYNLGLLNFKLGDLEKSIKYFKKTISLNPKFSSAYSSLGVIYFRLKNKNLALENYLKSVNLDPKNFLTNYNLGNYYLFYGDLKNSEKYFLKSIDLQPKNFYPYNNLFQIYDRSNDLKKLEQIIKKILNFFDKTPDVLFLEGIYEFRKKNYKKTVKIFEDLNFDENKIQRNTLKTNILAKSYDYIGEYSKAFEYFTIANDIMEKSTKDKFDKNKYVDLVKKKLNFFSNNLFKPSVNTEIYDEYIDPVFLIGFPRSGTTLLDTILRSHKSINVIEEQSLVDNLINDLNNNMKANFSNLNLITSDKVKELRNSYFKKREDLVGYEKKIIYIDKMPLNIINVVELNKIFPNAKFILALRNPYDVVLSCFMQPFIPNDAMSNFYNLKDSADLYDLIMELWKKYNQILTLNTHTVKYESVVNYFDDTMKELINFLNIEWSDELKNFHLTAQKRGIIHTPSYDQVNQPLYKQSILKWKNYSDQFLETNAKLSKWAEIFKY
jgi:tetratricopeptide (TPR) repeat protein